MMNKIEEAIIYATVMHQGKIRKLGSIPYILHPLEVAQILATLTDDEDIITAGILHDIVDDTDGTLAEIGKRFGERVAELVSSESEKEFLGENPEATWRQRKEETIRMLSTTQDLGIKMVWLADTLANIRSLAGAFSEQGEKVWQKFHQTDASLQHWYYRGVAEQLELTLNKTAAFKELIKHINSIWPGTFDSEKARYKKYRELSVDGCKLIGRGAKGDVYRYDDELVVKVYNQKNTYSDVEREIALSRKAFVMGIPTAISFGIVSVGDRYGAMYELVESDTISRRIARNPEQVETYAKMMADLARTIHSIDAAGDDDFPDVRERLRPYIEGGVGRVDKELAERCMKLVDGIGETSTLLHGDFHTSNVFLLKDEPMLIDMDRLSRGHPVAELSDMYYFYVVLGEDDPMVVENFMGFSYETAKTFFRLFLRHYIGTDNEYRLNGVIEKASLLAYSRKIRMMYKKRSLSDRDERRVEHYTWQVRQLADKLDTLLF